MQNVFFFNENESILLQRMDKWRQNIYFEGPIMKPLLNSETARDLMPVVYDTYETNIHIQQSTFFLDHLHLILTHTTVMSIGLSFFFFSCGSSDQASNECKTSFKDATEIVTNEKHSFSLCSRS